MATNSANKWGFRRPCGRRSYRFAAALALAGGLALALPFNPASAYVGVSDTSVRIGGVMDLEGRSRGLGRGMKVGIEAALRGKRVKGRTVEFVTMNDSYTPAKTIEATDEMLAKGVFLMIGNVGTPTARVSLPTLAERGVPALGFFTGAGILRPGVGDIVNFRASYVQETAAVIGRALAAGVKPNQICAYVQNDGYGMAGVAGIKRALSGRPNTRRIIASLNEILAMNEENPPRNFIAPVGVYQRNTFTSRDGYRSLKSWEERNDTQCRLVVTVGTYAAISKFVAYSRYKGEGWIISAVSFTGADNYSTVLNDSNVTDKIIMTQVVPVGDVTRPIVAEAKKALGDDFGFVSLEGFIVGTLFLEIANSIEGELTRESFLEAVRGRRFDLGGLEMDFTTDNQGSDLVVTTYLTADGWKPTNRSVWHKWLN